MYKLAVIIPTRNEAQALPDVITGLTEALKGVNFQIIVIDDGNDNTPEVLCKINNPHVLFHRRSPSERNGLSGAVIMGFSIADSEYVGVMDGDGQHPATLMSQLLQEAQNGNYDMVMASRYISGASNEGLDGTFRKLYSNLLRQIPRAMFPILRRTTDPLGGLFLTRKSRLKMEKLRPIGWKIGMEVLLFSQIYNYHEIGYEFHERIGGVSKANVMIGIEYFRQLFSLVFRYYLSGTTATTLKRQQSHTK